MATERPDASRDFSTCEVLVHITAPSSAQDDARFTSIAAALLNFQPAKRAKVAELDFISSHPVPTNTEINATEQEPSPKQRQSHKSKAEAARHSLNDQALGCNSEHTVFQPAGYACPEALPFANVSGALPSRSPEAWPHNRTAANTGYSTGRLVTHHSENCNIYEKRSYPKPRRLLAPENEHSVGGGQPLQYKPCINRQHLDAPKVRPADNSSSLPSTMSPSQPLHWQAPTCNNRATVPGFEPAIGFSTPIYPVMGRPDEEVSQQTPTRHRHGEGLTNSQPLDRARQPRHRQSFPSQLSDQIHGPNPQGGHTRFVTHVTKTLRKLAIRVPLSKHFYPYCVTRDVRVLERGYWEFLVGIIESPTTPDPRQAQQKRRNDEPISLCSGRDFLQLWRNVSRFIKDGKAGWGTSIVRKQVRRGLWRIRLFTWAEILGHIWLVLWVLSDKLIENIPMHWIDGRGTAVVTMSGRKQRRNGRYIWAPKSTEGERGCWGMRKLEMV